MKYKSALGMLIIFVLSFNQFFTYPVFAQEFVVSGNGEGSSNSISFQAEENSQIEQTNTADIENQVQTEAQTGSNEASGNSGEVEIETGDITGDVVIVNSGNNSTAQISCCKEEDPSTAAIENNGASSDNSIDVSDNSSAAVNVKNELSIQNNIDISANTGDNEALGNDGNVSIQTGKINLLAAILNKNLNTADVSVSNSGKGFDYFIKKNGEGSNNSITEDNKTENEYSVFNDLYLNNDIKNYSNTGNNKANKNNGKVFISTGDVFLDIILKNKDINTSRLVEVCCAKASPAPSPSGSPQPSPSGSPTTAPSSPPQGSCCSPTTDIPGPGGGGGGSSGSSSSGGEVLGANLPATGGFSLWTLTFLALLMLGVGVILRSDFAYEKFKHKEILGKFTDSFKSYIFGIYLFANLKGLSSGKA